MKLTRILFALMLALFFSGGAHAVLLSTLFNGGSITAGDKLFDNWSLSSFNASDANRGFNASNIDVSALADGGLSPGPGLKFTVSDGELAVLGSGAYSYVDLIFGYRATVLAPGLLISGNSLDFSFGGAVLTWFLDGTTDNGVVVKETVGTASGVDDLVSGQEIEFSVLNNVTTSNIADSASFAPQSSVWVTTDIRVWATDLNDSAAFSGLEQRFSQTPIPEPDTFWLLGLGLVGMGLAKVRADKVRRSS